MAVIQISRIQVRRGAISDQALPQLASGEFGWAVDTQQLFIGNGSVAEGSPAVGNTEILTERSIFDVLTNFTSTVYTYRGHNPAISIQTGPDANQPVERTLQHRLDETISVLSFGAFTTATNFTNALQRAVNENFKTGREQKILRIPSGTYFSTGTVNLPRNCILVGDGIDRTVIYAVGTGSHATLFNTTASNIQVSSMTLAYTATTDILQSSPLIKVTNAEHVSLSDIRFVGNYDPTSAVATTSSYSAILIDDPVVVSPAQTLSVEDCIIENLCYPLTCDSDVSDIVIQDNVFKNLYQGITLADNLQGTGQKVYGPSRVQIKDNKFERIQRQAIFAGANTATNNQINSESNVFIEVGNDINGSISPYTPIITFESYGNSSVNDDFERLWDAQTTAVNYPQEAVVEGTAKVELKFTDIQIMAVSTATQTLFRIPCDGIAVTGVNIEYIIEKLNLSRKGTLSVVGGPNGASVKDSYTLAGNSLLDDLAFTAALVDTTNPVGSNYDTLAIQYENLNTTGVCTFNISYYR
jgi:hypothetical protein